MRCQCCNKVLNDFEATKRHSVTMDFTDMCNKCLKGLGIETIDRSDLSPYEETPDDEVWPEDETDAQDCNEWDEEEE